MSAISKKYSAFACGQKKGRQYYFYEENGERGRTVDKSYCLQFARHISNANPKKVSRF